MEKVDAEAVDLGPELRKRVEPSLETSHVVAVPPIVDKSPRSHQRHALRPIVNGWQIDPDRGHDRRLRGCLGRPESQRTEAYRSLQQRSAQTGRRCARWVVTWESSFTDCPL